MYNQGYGTNPYPCRAPRTISRTANFSSSAETIGSRFNPETSLRDAGFSSVTARTRYLPDRAA